MRLICCPRLISRIRSVRPQHLMAIGVSMKWAMRFLLVCPSFRPSPCQEQEFFHCAFCALQLVGGYRSCPILACELADAMFDGQRMMTARQLYFTLATAFASRTYGHQSSWQLEANSKECGAAVSGMPAGLAVPAHREHADGQDFAAARPPGAVEGSSGESELLSASWVVTPTKYSEHFSQQASDESQLAVEGRMRFSGTMKSTGYGAKHA